MKHAGYNSAVFDYQEVGGTTVLGNVLSNKNQYKYNGQEFQDELGLNITAMDYRQYDNALGRFHGVDLLSELDYSSSPYTFGLNNPIYWSDPSGLTVTLSGGGNNFLLTATGNDAGKLFGALVNAMDGRTTHFTTEDYTGVPVFETFDSLESYYAFSGGGGGESSSGISLNGIVLPEVTIYGNSSTWLSQIQQHVYDNSPYYDSGWVDVFGKYNTAIGLGLTALEHTPGSVRFGTSVRGFSPKYYGNAWTGNQYAKTFNIGKIGRGLGNASAFAGVFVDAIGVFNYYDNPNSPNAVHPGKAGLNTGMTAYGIWISPPTAIVYGVVDSFYPGGWNGFLYDSNEFNIQGQKINGPGWRLVPFGPK